MRSSDMKAIDKVKLVRKPGRKTSQTYIRQLVSDFIELHGDRRFGDDKAIIGGIGRINDRAVTVVALERGRDTDERVARNFGSAHPEGYRKALRLMKQAEKFHRPVICLVDTLGAYCGVGAEERGQGAAIANNLMEMMTLRTPIITIIIGEGGSGGALALSVADRVWMLENTVYSVISPEGGASVIWKDASKKADMAENLKLTADDMLRMGVIEKIIPEDEDGADAEKLKDSIIEALDELEKIDTQELTDMRYKRFRKFGVYSEIKI
jgi:acetyl-CoA carboxylase carboxyl transferase subunit alpha